jgi:ribulose-5-phosphate 4-epimerase/fuculose-1-phosphate aldolase
MPNNPSLSSELVKFTWEQISPAPPSDLVTRALRAACDELDALDLLASYQPGNPVGSSGNLSVRTSPDGGFVVTATQLPSKRALLANDFVYLDRYEFEGEDEMASKAYYSGGKLPSSESILHWYYYRRHAEIGAIVHVHENTDLLYSPSSRAAWDSLGVVETDRYGDAGTVDLPRSVEEVLQGLNQYVILKEHWPEWDKAHTGAIVFGKTLQEAQDRVIEVHHGLVMAGN